MSTSPPARPAFELKSTAWTLASLRLHTSDMTAVVETLQRRYGRTPTLFENDAVVVDLSALRDAAEPIDFAALDAALQRHRLRLVAVQGGSEEQMAAALSAGFVEAMDAAPEAPPAAAATAPTEVVREVEVIREVVREVPAPGGAAPTMVIDRPLRSGQRVYARGGDLVVLTTVSFGAEIIADGHIHVYGPLRGRAMAGARGDTSARIFTTAMEAQLVSVAGIYRTSEQPLPAQVQGRAAQVRLDGERLLVESLAT
jgi:septum site-determining protein MinC